MRCGAVRCVQAMCATVAGLNESQQVRMRVRLGGSAGLEVGRRHTKWLRFGYERWRSAADTAWQSVRDCECTVADSGQRRLGSDEIRLQACRSLMLLRTHAWKRLERASAC